MYAFACVCMLCSLAYLPGVRYVPQRVRSRKGVWRYLNEDGHEHITSCLFSLYNVNHSVGGSENRSCARHVLGYDYEKSQYDGVAVCNNDNGTGVLWKR